MKFSLKQAGNMSKMQNAGFDFEQLDHHELLQKIGLQLGAVEDYIDYRDLYSSVFVVRVVSCVKHPDADKLHVCLIDDGGATQDVERNDDGLIQVVCGAPNVRADTFVAWIPPGSTVPNTRKNDPFVLASREIRGEMSNGMLASAHELALSDDHEGILVFTEHEVAGQLIVGSPLCNYLGLDDFIVDCENKMFTHRPDCFGNLGIAREVAGIYGIPFKSPDWYSSPIVLNDDMRVLSNRLSIQAQNSIPELVSRFSLQVIENVELRSSPLWLRVYLHKVGMRSINNIVDLTNYYMHLTAQPTHAFDYDKLRAVGAAHDDTEITLQPRKAREGESLELLNGQTIKLHPEDIIIACNDVPVALAGVMGGSSTEVDEHTKNIVIECASFDMYAIRRTSMRHGLFSDAVTRFNKGQSPLQNDRILAKLTEEMCLMAGGKAGENVDIASFDQSVDNLTRVELAVDFINARLGIKLASNDIVQLLENVEFACEVQDSNIVITVPFWRMDIAITEDIVEEVGRLYGYNKIPTHLPNRSAKPAALNLYRERITEFRQKLRQLGANELLTYSFVHGDLMRKLGVDPDANAYHIRNALSPDLQYYRTSLLPSLLSKVHPNLKIQAGDDTNEFALFEFGKVHVKGQLDREEPTLPWEMKRLGFVVAADDKTARKYAGSPYYHAKLYLEQLFACDINYELLEDHRMPATSVFQPQRSAQIIIEGQVIGYLGELNAQTIKIFKLPKYSAAFEIDTLSLIEFTKKVSYQPLSTYPSSHQDITLEVDAEVTWQELERLLHAELAVAKAEFGYSYLLQPIDIYQDTATKKKRMTFRITFSHNQKTLKTEEINKLLDTISGSVHESLAAIRV